jgi:hypothetical protein
MILKQYELRTKEAYYLLIYAWLVDDIYHSTTDLSMDCSFRKMFEKCFDFKSDVHVQVYLGNQIEHTSVKGTVTVDQEHYVLAFLENFSLI